MARGTDATKTVVHELKGATVSEVFFNPTNSEGDEGVRLTLLFEDGRSLDIWAVQRLPDALSLWG